MLSHKSRTLKNETLDYLKKPIIALRYISFIRGKHNIEDIYTKRLSDFSFNNTFLDLNDIGSGCSYILH